MTALTIDLAAEEVRLLIDALHAIRADADRYGEYGGNPEDRDGYLALIARLESVTKCDLQAEVHRLREAMAWVQEVHGIDDDKLAEFLQLLNGRK